MSMRDQRFVAAPLIQVVATEESGAVLLDLQTDRFLGLDPMGMFLWTHLITGHTLQEIEHLVAESYVIDAEEALQEDILRFLQQMESQQLLLRAQNTRQAKKQPFGGIPVHILLFLFSIVSLLRISEWLEAWFLLQWIHRFLVHGKLIELARRLQALPARYFVTDKHPDVQRFTKLVQSAAAWQSFNAVCLHQNLALGFLLRRRGLHADLVIGVSTFPFFAHAWLRSRTEILHWKTGLGPGVTLQRLQELSIIFCTEWLSDDDGKEESKR